MTGLSSFNEDTGLAQLRIHREMKNRSSGDCSNGNRISGMLVELYGLSNTLGGPLCQAIRSNKFGCATNSCPPAESEKEIAQ